MAKWSPEDLAEMAAADAEIEATFRLTNEEISDSKALDREALISRKDYKQRKVAAQQKAYREANREKVAAQKKA